MPPYGEPDWSAPGATATPAPPAGMENVNHGVANQAPSKDRSKLWQNLISVLLMGLSSAMVALGVLTMLDNLSGPQDFAEYFIAIYLIFFATLLFFYELMWWCTIVPMNRLIRKNFGFIYKVRGKALYMIVIACLCIGIDSNILGKNNWLKWVAGIGWMATGIFIVFATFAAPTVFANYNSPTAGFPGSDPVEQLNETV